MPKSFSLSTVLGTATAVYTALQHAFPQSPWVAMVGAALTAVAMPETPKKSSPDEK